ncbi:MAG: hypothetical protein HOP09_13210 [Hyphomicrobium sp.]|nr:hypothetical protein [Hyphomicrobium sp.]
MKRITTIAAALVFAPCLALAAETAAPATTAPAATAGPAAAASADPAGTAGERGQQRWSACASDLQKFCANIERARGAKRTCLESHAAELSDGCKTRMAEKRPAAN